MKTDDRFVIEGKVLKKTYGTVTALSGIDFTARKGTITGLVGPDGAGKSTLIRIVLTLITPDSGSLCVSGCDPVKDRIKIRSRTGYMPETFSLYSDLSVEENLQFSFRIHQMDADLYTDRLERLYSFNHLKAFAKTRAGALSGGMKQKLALSCAMMHDPELLVLDEPTTGVDPLSRREFWQMLQELRDSGLSILVSTPYMDEALLCDSICLMFHGTVIDSGAPASLTASFSGTMYEITSQEENNDRITGLLHRMYPDAAVYLSGRKLHFGTSRPDTATPEPALPAGTSVRRIQPDLEDLFMMNILQRR